MKDTQIEWIGQIPDDWEVKRFKYIHSGTNVGESIDKEFWSQDENEYVFYTAGETNIYNTYNKFPNWKFVKSCDLLLARNGTPYVYLPPVDAQYSDHIIRTSINKDIDKRFVRYCLQLSIENEKVEVVSLATWSVSIWNEQKLPLPNITEQKLIADFLDKQTAKIDAIIKTNEEQLEVLKKYKKSLITQTVTKGLNKNARMKDSGIEWIGKIPEDWDVSKIKYEVSQTGSGTTPDSGYLPYYENGTNNWIQSGDLYQKDYIRETETKITDLAVRSSKSLRFYTKNFIVIAMYGASVGNISLSLIDAYTNQACCTIKNNNENSLKYMFYYLQMCHEHLLTLAVGGGQPNISQVILKNLEFIKPKLNDQIEIANFLDEKLTKIEPIISQKQQAIETMQKYKKSLIYEYVTGKKRIK